MSYPRYTARPAKDMMLFLVWDEESEEHLDKTILGNSFQASDSGPDKKKKRKSEDTSSSSEEELTGFGADGGSLISPRCTLFSVVGCTRCQLGMQFFQHIFFKHDQLRFYFLNIVDIFCKFAGSKSLVRPSRSCPSSSPQKSSNANIP